MKKRVDLSNITWRRRRRNQRGNVVLGTSTVRDGSFSRYPLDACCRAAEGWMQYDTSQDAWYFGCWVHPGHREILTYAEGDLTLVVCGDALSFNAEIAFMNGFYGEGFAFKTVDQDGITVYRQDRRAFFIPLLPPPARAAG